MTEGKERELTDKIRLPSRGWAWYISRAKAIAEGDLIDVTEQAREAGMDARSRSRPWPGTSGWSGRRGRG